MTSPTWIAVGPRQHLLVGNRVACGTVAANGEGDATNLPRCGLCRRVPLTREDRLRRRNAYQNARNARVRGAVLRMEAAVETALVRWMLAGGAP